MRFIFLDGEDSEHKGRIAKTQKSGVAKPEPDALNEFKVSITYLLVSPVVKQINRIYKVKREVTKVR